MSLNFPTSPVGGQQYEGFYWDAVAEIWRRITAETIAIKYQAGTSYTLELVDRNSIIEFNNAAEITVTIPSDSSVSFPKGSVLSILQAGDGPVFFEGAEGVTVDATPGLRLRDKWSSATILKRETNTWVILGDLVDIDY
jgi:hypothetical protein